MFFTQEFIYLCNMKNFLFILTLLFGMLLFVPEDVQNNDTTLDLQVQKEAVMIEKGTADMQHNLEILSSDLKGCNCLTPRRSIQNVSNTLNIRLLKIEEKAIQYFRLKEINLLRKVSNNFIIHLKNQIIMSTKKNKFSIYIYVVITIIGCVLACSSIVPNDYLKLVVVMGALGVGLYGIMKGLSTPSTTEETASPEK